MNKDRNYNPFDRIRVEVPETNTFSLTHDNKLSLNMGLCYPVLCMETFPGDKFRITPEMLMRLAPMTFPIMHGIDVYMHFFYVPHRINWQHWEKFIAGEAVVRPYFQGNVGTPWLIEAGSIWDYLGYPSTANMLAEVDAWDLLAYLRVMNEYYQDQNNDPNWTVVRDQLQAISNMTGLIDPSDIIPTATTYQDIPLFNRAWEHDYFTSALPFAQKGNAVSIPLQLANMPVEVATMEEIVGGGDPNFPFPLTSGAAGLIGVDGAAVKILGNTIGAGALTGTINELRVAEQLQMFLEANARGGSRYPEQIKIHWGTNIGDDRVSRPEYLGGLKNNVVISEVLQTYGEAGSEPLGTYAGHGTAVASGNSIFYSCPEHGRILGILSVRPKTAYFQGLARDKTRATYLDYPVPQFSHLGEQAILKREVYYANDGDNDETFGYIPRYSELKYKPSEVHGQFKTTMLDFHLARNFASRPVLNDEFVYVNDDKRIFAVTDPDVDSLYAHVFFDIEARRKFPFYTDPWGSGAQ